MKLPAFQFYVGDWRKDPGVQSLDFYTRGVWFEMLCLMHESSERGVLLLNDKPMPLNALARLLGIDIEKLNECIVILDEYGIFSKREHDDAIYSRRMVSDERLICIRREAGKQGGNPNLLKQNSSKIEKEVNLTSKQIPTPSSSSSSSSSSSKKETIIVSTFKNWNEEQFKEDIIIHKGNYSSEMLKAFFAHFSEKDQFGKMRMQKEKTWETKKRLAKWSLNDYGKTTKTNQPTFTRASQGVKMT
jgi:hypothetical protein